jgi:PilZ domain
MAPGTLYSGSRIRASTVKEYESRSFRSDLGLPVRFFSAEGLITGHSVNISASGMLARFDKPVAIWMVGELNIHLDEGYINLRARVARIAGREAGLAFYIDDDDDRLAIGRLLDFGCRHDQPVV